MIVFRLNSNNGALNVIIILFGNFLIEDLICDA